MMGAGRPTIGAYKKWRCYYTNRQLLKNCLVSNNLGYRILSYKINIAITWVRSCHVHFRNFRLSHLKTCIRYSRSSPVSGSGDMEEEKKEGIMLLGYSVLWGLMWNKFVAIELGFRSSITLYRLHVVYTILFACKLGVPCIRRL